MPLSRRAAWFLTLTGAFQWVIWPTFLRNVWKDDRSFSDTGSGPTAFLVVHAVLTVVSLALGSGVLLVGVRGLRRS